MKSKVKYSLIPLHLGDEEGKFVAKVQEVETVSQLQLAKDIQSELGDLSVEIIQAVLNTRKRVTMKHISNGRSVDDGLGRTSFSIEGTSSDEDVPLNKSSARLHINYHLSQDVKILADDISLEKINPNNTNPEIYSVSDWYSNTIDTYLTSGGVLEIKGNNLKVDGTDPKVGAYLISSDNTEYELKLKTNSPKQIQCIVPGLQKGTYTLRIATQYSGGSKHLKTVKETIYNKQLTVV